MRRFLMVAALGLVASAASAQQTGQAMGQETSDAALPGGATQLTERHGDWAVSCAVAQEGKDCALSQAARSPTNGANLVAMELGVPDDGNAEGMMLTAFGLRLDAGIRLGVDGAQMGQPMPFLTCISTGCVVPVRFDEAAVATLKAGTRLEVTGVKVEDGQPITIGLSLAGFTAAFQRTADLGQ